MKVSPTLRVLRLSGSAGETHDLFLKWPGLLNLTEIHFNGFNFSYIKNLLEFIRHRPKFENFSTYEMINDSVDEMIVVGETLAEYCGDNIKIFGDRTETYYPYNNIHQSMSRYDFLSKFKNLEELTVITM